MALFQKSVIKNYLALQDAATVQKAYHKYTKYFHNATIQENIKGSKEEQFQAKFLDELFVNILGYTMNPKPDYNLTTEFKNQKNNRKADGALLANGKAIGVIELKGTNTKDLESIRKQAFDYKANQKDCVYVVTSNFEKLRFYINDATEFEEFNLFMVSEEEFALLYLCLHKDNILSNLPLKIKEESIIQEEQITKKFYADYSLFKRELFRDLVRQNVKRIKNEAVIASATKQSHELSSNPDDIAELKQLEKNVKLALFKKSQKLIDRFLFVFFAEDRNLLPANSTAQILNKWKADIDFGDERPLYDLFKQYFKYLDSGRKGTTSRAEIYAYNGGLFKPDSILDNLVIDDQLLYKHTLKLATYDFESQVDVNILGHIFENSLNEIESVNAEIEGAEFDKQKSKRKKDGVFYTPKYITKYIVENTVGKLCEEKKVELGFQEEEYFKSRANRPKKKLQELVDLLDTYRNWLLQLTICDPACGSGAFLNQALDFLIKEHRYIDELKANVLGGGLVLSDIENTILENNIYGVDLNEESVEIAKLSLWLRTAQPRRKLNDLNSNIKCGNSLIDDKKVAGDKAFNWEKEFSQIFNPSPNTITTSLRGTKQSAETKRGFDVVIGNPPYVRQELFKEIKPYLEKNYECYNSVADLYTYFIEKGINLMNEKGSFSFILPNKFLKASYGRQIRKVIKEKTNLELLFDFDDYPVFDDATTYPIIYVLNKNKSTNKEYFIYSEINKRDFTIDPIGLLNLKAYEVLKSSLNNDVWNFIDKNSEKVFKKLFHKSVSLNDYVNKKVFLGIKTGKNDAFIIDDSVKDILENEDIKSKELIKSVATGKDIYRYRHENSGKYIILTEYDINVKSKYPSIFSWLSNFEKDLIKRGDKGKNWWNLRPCDYYDKIQKPKIIWRSISNECGFYLDNEGSLLLTNNNYFIASDSKALIAILNSKLIFFYLKNICTSLQGGYFDFRRDKVLTVPISKNIEEINNIKLLELHVDDIQSSYSSFINTNNKFQRTLQRKFKGLDKLPKKLESWYELSYAEFIKELAKKKIKLSLSEEAEWEDYFTTEQQKALALKSQIDQTDKEIDAMVYELYGLTEEEIDIVKNS